MYDIHTKLQLGTLRKSINFLFSEKFDTYTQHPIIRNGRIRHGAEILEIFKKPLLEGSNLRNSLK